MSDTPDMFTSGEVGNFPTSKETQDNRRFDWFEDDSIIVESQPALAVYRNIRNHIVIRQEDSANLDGEDICITVAGDENIRLLIRALQREIGDA